MNVLNIYILIIFIFFWFVAKIQQIYNQQTKKIHLLKRKNVKIKKLKKLQMQLNSK